MRNRYIAKIRQSERYRIVYAVATAMEILCVVTLLCALILAGKGYLAPDRAWITVGVTATVAAASCFCRRVSEARK